MKSMLIILSAFFTCSCGNQAGAAVPLPPENQFIVEETKAGAFVVAGPKDVTYWTPSRQETKAALSFIYRYLEKSHSSELKNIFGIFKEYRVQFVGYMKGGHKIIYCNFFRNVSPGDRFPYWKEKEVLVLDGGYSFWQCSFDLADARLFDIFINGYA